MYHSLVYFGMIKVKCSIPVDQLFNLAKFGEDLDQSENCSSKIFSVFGIPAPVINALIFCFCAWLLYGKIFKNFKLIRKLEKGAKASFYKPIN